MASSLLTGISVVSGKLTVVGVVCFATIETTPALTIIKHANVIATSLRLLFIEIFIKFVTSVLIYLP